jgi:hypothetical protein
VDDLEFKLVPQVVDAAVYGLQVGVGKTGHRMFMEPTYDPTVNWVRMPVQSGLADYDLGGIRSLYNDPAHKITILTTAKTSARKQARITLSTDDTNIGQTWSSIDLLAEKIDLGAGSTSNTVTVDGTMDAGWDVSSGNNVYATNRIHGDRSSAHGDWSQGGILSETGNSGWAHMATHASANSQATIWGTHGPTGAMAHVRNSANTGWVDIWANAYPGASSLAFKSDVKDYTPAQRLMVRGKSDAESASFLGSLEELRPVIFKRGPHPITAGRGRVFEGASAATLAKADLRTPTAKKNEDHERIGFIAEEVEKVFPEVCYWMDYDGTPKVSAIDYSAMVPVLVGAIRELAGKVSTLEAQLEGANK